MAWGVRRYLRNASMLSGSSTYPFHSLEKRAMVAPSTTLWSADHDTGRMEAGTRVVSIVSCGWLPPPFLLLLLLYHPGRVEAYLGRRCTLPMAPMATVPGGMTGDMYVPPTAPMLERLGKRVGWEWGGEGVCVGACMREWRKVRWVLEAGKAGAETRGEKINSSPPLT